MLRPVHGAVLARGNDCALPHAVRQVAHLTVEARQSPAVLGHRRACARFDTLPLAVLAAVDSIRSVAIAKTKRCSGRRDGAGRSWKGKGTRRVSGCLQAGPCRTTTAETTTQRFEHAESPSTRSVRSPWAARRRRGRGAPLASTCVATVRENAAPCARRRLRPPLWQWQPLQHGNLPRENGSRAPNQPSAGETKERTP